MIEPRLKNTGAMAGIAKLLRAFNMPIAFAASAISSKNGIMMRVRCMVNSALPGTSKKPGASK